VSGTNASRSFGQLHPEIQRFLWEEQWESLRDAQERAIPPILEGAKDVIIAAATAAGKTEAAFLPALTRLMAADGNGLIIYISPLKALINDQFMRLERLCERMEIPVHPWHGDVASSKKRAMEKDPRGVLLITPESLEASFILRGHRLPIIFGKTQCVIIDELHAFIGSERGQQLQSLLHRMELAIQSRLPRIGLSATLGDMAIAADFLRPGHGDDVLLIDSGGGDNEIKLLVKGYIEPRTDKKGTTYVPPSQDEPSDEDLTDESAAGASSVAIARDLYKAMAGSNNLIFPGSRQNVELFTYLLNRIAEATGAPQMFWAHHGSLSRESREETEAALKQKETPATAVCTSTLEMGIDIGSVKNVGQVGAPSSVASLRQRLGRSGRRKGEASILRGYISEWDQHPDNPPPQRLRLKTIQFAACVSLLLEGWFEPPRAGGLHLSTLIMQLMSLIAERGGVRPADLYAALCGPRKPFHAVTTQQFQMLLRALAAEKWLAQDSDGTLLHGPKGDAAVNHYSFYSAFQTPEEFRLVAGTRSLGTIPADSMLAVGHFILFSGRTWRVTHIDDKARVINVERSKTGKPLPYGGIGPDIHMRVCTRMREILEGTVEVPFLDMTANAFLLEAREEYQRLRLNEQSIVHDRGAVYLFTWAGTHVNRVLAAAFRYKGLMAGAEGAIVVIEAFKSDNENIFTDALAPLANEELTIDELLSETAALEREKWDHLLPHDLQVVNYASVALDLPGAAAWAKRFLDASESNGKPEPSPRTGA